MKDHPRARAVLGPQSRAMTQALTPGGGIAPFLKARMPKAEIDELDREAQRLGTTRSDLLRRLVRYGLTHADSVLGTDKPKEVMPQAS